MKLANKLPTISLCAGGTLTVWGYLILLIPFDQWTTGGSESGVGCNVVWVLASSS